MTDSGFLSDEALACLSDVRLLAIESNHDEHLLDIGPYPTALKRRVASDAGHLSNVQSAKYLESLLSARLETVVGMHLSETNNEPRLAVQAAQQVLANECHPCALCRRGAASSGQPMVKWRKTMRPQGRRAICPPCPSWRGAAKTAQCAAAEADRY